MKTVFLIKYIKLLSYFCGYNWFFLRDLMILLIKLLKIYRKVKSMTKTRMFFRQNVNCKVKRMKISWENSKKLQRRPSRFLTNYEEWICALVCAYNLFSLFFIHPFIILYAFFCVWLTLLWIFFSLWPLEKNEFSLFFLFNFASSSLLFSFLLLYYILCTLS